MAQQAAVNELLMRISGQFRTENQRKTSPFSEISRINQPPHPLYPYPALRQKAHGRRLGRV
jgi:hypothetical protein